MKRLLFASICLAALLADASAGTAVVIKDPRQDPAVQQFQSKPVQDGAGDTPFQLSLITPAQLPPEDWDVNGFAINLLYGTSHNFKGLALGGIATRTTGRTDGLMIAGLANVVESDSTSLQISLGVNYTEFAFTGMQIGAANVAASDDNSGAEAFQIGALYNYANSINGVQISLLINRANFIKGLQIGLINFAGDMVGVQIGLVNIIDSKDFPFVPIINGRF